MATSKVEVWNLALIQAGHSQLVANEEEDSTESRLCSTIYEQCRDFVLREFPWRFAKARVALALIEGQPNSSWLFQYSLPADCLMVRSIVHSGQQHDLPCWQIAFEVADNGDGPVLFTNAEQAEMIYTKRVTNVQHYDPSFVTALSLYMATLLVIPLKGKPDIAQMLQKAYSRAVHQAAANSLNEAFVATKDDSLLSSRNG